MASSDELLSRVFALALEARVDGDHPFGALLAVDGVIVAEARNKVTTGRDITAHAETELVRVLEREALLGSLAGGIVYASCEPCPQCVGALFWAGARHIRFGLSAASLNEISTPTGTTPYGFTISAAELASASTRPMRVDGPFREEEAAQAHHGFWR